MAEALFPVYEIRYETLFDAYPWAVVSASSTDGAMSLLEKRLRENIPRDLSDIGFKMCAIVKNGANCDQQMVLYPLKKQD